MQNALIAGENSVTGGFIASATLFGMTQLVGYLSWRSKTAERLLEGTPRVLVRNGHVFDDALAAEQIARSELIEALRREGCTSLTKVRYAVLENDGSITIGLRAETQGTAAASSRNRPGGRCREVADAMTELASE